MTVQQASSRECRCEVPQWRYGGRSDVPHERCERPQRLVCLGCDAVRQKRCSRSSRVACVPCSETYRRRVRRVFASGWRDDVPGGFFMLTLTAPGREQHRRRDGQVCPCTPLGGISEAEWNATAGKRFNKFMTYVRRRYGDVQYARAAEVQRRGLLHFHVLLRTSPRHNQRLSEDYGRSADAPLRLLAIACGFGHEIRLDAIDPVSVGRAAHYCAKYVSKSAADRESLPWLERTGEIVMGQSRYRPWSSSRRWGLTMAAIRRAQASWWASGAAAEEAGDAGRIGGGTAGPQAGGALDPSSRSYTGVVRSAGGVACPQNQITPVPPPYGASAGNGSEDGCTRRLSGRDR